MNCYICDAPLGDIRLDPRDLKPRPCYVCEEIISEAIFEMDDDELEEESDET